MLSWVDEAIPTINVKVELELRPPETQIESQMWWFVQRSSSAPAQLALTFTHGDPLASLSQCEEQKDHGGDQEKQGGSRTQEGAADLRWGLRGPLMRGGLGGKLWFRHCQRSLTERRHFLWLIESVL